MGRELISVRSIRLHPARHADHMDAAFGWLSAGPCTSYTFEEIQNLPEHLLAQMLHGCNRLAEQLRFPGGRPDTAQAAAIAKELPRFTAIKRIGMPEMRLEADDWAALLAAMGPAVEEFDFTSCSLDTAKAIAIAQKLPRFTALKKIDMRGNDHLQADGWAALLAAMGPTVEEFDFSDCGFDTAKATAIAQELPRFTALKKINLAENRNLEADDWAALLAAMGPTVEELYFTWCSLNTAKAAAIAQKLPRFTALKKINLAGNTNLEADGWAALLAAMGPAVEEFDFSYCDFNTAKAIVIAQKLPPFTALKKIDMRGNDDLEEGDWAALQAAAPGARLKH